jgi:hypothetical protein
MTEFYFEIDGRTEKVLANSLAAAGFALIYWWKWQSREPLPPIRFLGVK